MLTREQKYTLRLVGNRLGLFIPRDMIILAMACPRDSGGSHAFARNDGAQ